MEATYVDLAGLSLSAGGRTSVTVCRLRSLAHPVGCYLQPTIHQMFFTFYTGRRYLHNGANQTPYSMRMRYIHVALHPLRPRCSSASLP